MIPLSEEIEIAVLVGPSFYSIKQDFIDTVTPVETAPPYNTVTHQLGFSESSSRSSAVAFTAALDGTYLLTPKFGIGAFFRYSGASTDMPLSGAGRLRSRRVVSRLAAGCGCVSRPVAPGIIIARWFG